MNEMGQCLEAYRLKMGLYYSSFHGGNVVPKSHSRVTPEARISMTVCCCHAWLSWLLFNTSSRYAW